jgi:hypothetical protein
MEKITFTLLGITQYYCEENNGEEIALFYKGKKLWPAQGYRKIKGETLPIQISLSVSNREHLTIEVVEYNWIIYRRKLGVFDILIEDAGGPFNTDISGLKSPRFNLQWQVNRKKINHIQHDTQVVR